ncbi:MAG: hypothetical protein HY874_04760 [Chloroflexi bacterium]|nr:hypothetical protein [Chloroflexota bacterium]
MAPRRAGASSPGGEDDRDPAPDTGPRRLVKGAAEEHPPSATGKDCSISGIDALRVGEGCRIISLLALSSDEC